MMKIHTYPDPVLRARCEPVLNIDEHIQKLVHEMIETMYAAPGVGLAANQVGELKRLLVYDIAPKDTNRAISILINPEIVLTEGEIIHDEACLSVWDYSAEIKRHAQIKVKGLNLEGKPVDIEAEGLLAVCLQHEIDHLNGVLFIDHLSSLKRALYNKRLKKYLKNQEDPISK